MISSAMQVIMSERGLAAEGQEKDALVVGIGMKLEDIEKAVILATLKRQSYNRTRAAKVLGIGIRTLQRKLKQYRASDASLALELGPDSDA